VRTFLLHIESVIKVAETRLYLFQQMKRMNYTLACDIMMDLEGSIRPAMYLARELIARGHSVSMISPVMSSNVEESLCASGITPVNLRAKLVARNAGLSVLWLETWAREAFLRLNSKRIVNEFSVAINFSQVISVPSSILYLQGPPSIALKDMEKELSWGLRVAFNVLKPIVEYADGKLVSRMDKVSTIVVANSKFCASMYNDFGVKIHHIIYPPIDCNTFRPSTSNPSSRYVLTYFGKETKFSVVKRIADAGVKIKAFGSKTPFIPEKLMNHLNIDFAGRVTTDELVNLYSNALYTLFPFTHEPFGYVPLESMACGTPAVTYDMQGPSEYLTNEHTGWLLCTDDELVQRSVKLWKEGYPAEVRLNCTKEASKFDIRFYAEKWLKILPAFAGTTFAGLTPKKVVA
jgi:glycosyltransferase involved in cell wall biosynthesis